MEIKEFLDLWVDKWFGLRTSYQLINDKVENSKSEITIESLSTDHPEVVRLCQQYNVSPGLTLGGIKTSWDNSVDWGKSKETGSTIVVWIPEQSNPQVGKLLQMTGLSTILSGCYSLGNNDILSLAVDFGDTYYEERIWFASPNLRQRTSLVKSANGFSQTAFYSEIRRVAPKS